MTFARTGEERVTKQVLALQTLFFTYDYLYLIIEEFPTRDFSPFQCLNDYICLTFEIPRLVVWVFVAQGALDISFVSLVYASYKIFKTKDCNVHYRA